MLQFVFFIKLFLTITASGLVLTLLALSGYGANLTIFASAAFGTLIAIDTVWSDLREPKEPK